MPPETTSAAAILGWAARGQAIAAKSFKSASIDWMVANGAPSRAVQIVKAPTGSADLADLAGVTVTQWADSARTTSAFFRIMADGAFVKASINARVGITTLPATGVAIGEGTVIPMTAATVTSVTLTPTKVAAMIVVSDLLLRDISAAGQTSFNKALMGAISDQIDRAFLAKLVADAGAFTAASSGATAINARTDLRTALLNVNSSGGSQKLYWICGTNVAKRASTLADSAGGDAFQAMSATSGELAGLPCIVSSGIASDSLVLLDASALAADAGAPTITASVEATVEMDTAPVGTAAAVMTSMWQTNMTAIKASAWFGVQPLRDDAVAQITGIAWA